MQTKPQLDHKEVVKAFLDSSTYATVLHAICLNDLGGSIYEDDSVEIYAKLRDIYGVTLHEDNENKLMAMITAVSTPYFYHDTTAFASICEVLTTGEQGLAELDMELPTVLEILWADYEVGVNAEALEYSPAVERIVDLSMAEERMEDTDAYTHYAPVIQDMASELRQQLLAVGFTDIPEMPGI
jgi:hypothetical protein